MHPHLRHFKTKRIEGYQFWCPACNSIHVFTTRHPDPDLTWDFDGNASFEPSLSYELSPRCHAHLTDGKLRFYPDCEHVLAGQTVDMVPIPDDAGDERE
jgi:hypothetical protein